MSSHERHKLRTDLCQFCIVAYISDFQYFAGTPIGSHHDMSPRWAGSALVPVSSRSRLMSSPTGSYLPPPPSYQVATQYMLSPSKHVIHQFHQRHHRQQHTPVTSPHVPVTSSILAPAVTDRKMSFQLDSSTWRDREPTHFRWNMMAGGKTDNQEFHHTLPTSYDEVYTCLFLR